MATEFGPLFKGLDTLVNTKTVIGDVMKIDNATIVPIMEVTFGMASGSFSQDAHSAGAMSAKMTPVALYVMQNGTGKLISIKNTDAITKVVEMIPDFVNKLAGKKVSKDVEEKAKKIAEESEPLIEEF